MNDEENYEYAMLDEAFESMYEEEDWVCASHGIEFGGESPL